MSWDPWSDRDFGPLPPLTDAPPLTPSCLLLPDREVGKAPRGACRSAVVCLPSLSAGEVMVRSCLCVVFVNENMCGVRCLPALTW